LPENSASLDSNTACFEKPNSNPFTFLMALWLVVLVLPALASGSRVDAYSTKSGSLAEYDASTSDIPQATVEALTGWLHKKEYRYVIMSVPGMEATTGPPEKNYADFRNHMLACPGVCIGALTLRGQFHVDMAPYLPMSQRCFLGRLTKPLRV